MCSLTCGCRFDRLLNVSRLCVCLKAHTLWSKYLTNSNWNPFAWESGRNHTTKRSSLHKHTEVYHIILQTSKFKRLWNKSKTKFHLFPIHFIIHQSAWRAVWLFGRGTRFHRWNEMRKKNNNNHLVCSQAFNNKSVSTIRSHCLCLCPTYISYILLNDSYARGLLSEYCTTYSSCRFVHSNHIDIINIVSSLEADMRHVIIHEFSIQ